MDKGKKTEEELKFEAWIEECIEYYKPILGLTLNKIDVEKDDDCEYVLIKYTYPYIDTTIKYCNKALKNWQDGKLKKDLILHELCHLITDPLYTKALDRFIIKNTIEDEREQLTDTIAAIVRRLDENV